MDIATHGNRAFLSSPVSISSEHRAGLHTYDGLYVRFVLENLARLRIDHVSSRGNKGRSTRAKQPGARRGSFQPNQALQARSPASGSDSIERDKLAFSQSRMTSCSASCLQFIKLSIQPSSVGIVAGSWVGADGRSAGTRPTSSIFVSMARLAATGRRAALVLMVREPGSCCCRGCEERRLLVPAVVAFGQPAQRNWGGASGLAISKPDRRIESKRRKRRGLVLVSSEEVHRRSGAAAVMRGIKGSLTARWR